MDDFEQLKASAEEVTAYVMETAKELGLEVEPEDGLNCCNFMIKWTDEELLIMDEQGKWLLKMETTSIWMWELDCEESWATWFGLSWHDVGKIWTRANSTEDRESVWIKE